TTTQREIYQGVIIDKAIKRDMIQGTMPTSGAALFFNAPDNIEIPTNAHH
ncbi:hypothetical protein A2U01_0105109, partial [Trifolium medium]|nr:hypothetical protein [Trifolium medium]